MYLAERCVINMTERVEKFIDRKIKKEKINGQIYLMASPCSEHRQVQGNLSTILNDYFKKNKRKCRAIFDHDLYIDEDNTLEPDIKILCRETRTDNIPVLVIEVLSKSTQDRDYSVKMKIYAEIGIREYWLIDWKDGTAAVYLLSENCYKHYKTYALYIPNDKELQNLDEYEKTYIETVKEFHPVSFPELVVKMDDIFDIFI